MPMTDYGNTLQYSVLTKAIRLFENQGDHVGTQVFKDDPVMGRTAGIDIQYTPRTLAPYRHPEKVSGKQAMEQVKHIDVTMPTIKESVDLSADVLNVLRQPGTQNQKWGEAKVSRELANLKAIIDNRREWARWQVLTTGAVAYTGDQSFSVDFGISGTHTPALSGDNRWSVAASCDPISDILGWKKIYVRDSGVPARYGFMTSTVMGYLVKATNIRSNIGESLKTEVAVKGAIAQLCGLTLVEYDLGYTVSGTFYPFVGDTKFVLWSGNPFDEKVGIFADVKATSPGYFSKAFETDDPSGVTVLAGACAIPSGDRVNELFCATVHA